MIMNLKRITNLKRFASTGALALALSFIAVPLHAQYGPPPPPPGQDGGWEVPPPEMRAAMQQGYQDGIVGARKDVENRRRPNVNNRDEYRHPNVPHDVRRDYKRGFRDGYNAAMQHLYFGNGPRPY